MDANSPPEMAFPAGRVATNNKEQIECLDHDAENSIKENNNTDGISRMCRSAKQQKCFSTKSFSKCLHDLTVIQVADTEALSHQIAGHTRTGVLKHRLGYVLKSVQKPPLGQREVEFYDRVHNSHHCGEPDIHMLLREFIPNFYGVTRIESSKEDGNLDRKEYLVLDDIAQDYEQPCIVDVKIGIKTWDPLATEAKIEHERQKYIGTKEPLGLSVTGMQFFDISEQRQVKLDKEFGKQLNVGNIHEAFSEFLNQKAGVHQKIASKLVEKLLPLKKLFDAQRYYSFYSSSLLIVYDAVQVMKFRNNCADVNDKHCEPSVGAEDDWLRVKMIDFAHVFPSDGNLDENYIFGLDNLITIFSKITNEKFLQ